MMTTLQRFRLMLAAGILLNGLSSAVAGSEPAGVQKAFSEAARYESGMSLGPFREIEELQHVMGMTPEIYSTVSPYLTTRGTAAVNLNTAPVAVLRALPGMTDATLDRILHRSCCPGPDSRGR